MRVFLVLFAIFAVAFAASAKVDTKGELAPTNTTNGVWFVRVFQAGNTTQAPAPGPFSSIGLEPVPAKNATVGVPSTADVVKSILTTGNPNVPAGPAPVLVSAKILDAPKPNPLLPIDFNAPITALNATVLQTLKPAVILGIPDKRINREAYKEWKANQEPFGYLGLKKVPVQKTLSTGPVTIKTRHNKTKVITPVKVIAGNHYDATVQPIPVRQLAHLQPTQILEGVVAAPEPTPASVAAAIVAVPLPYYNDPRAANVAAVVPGAVTAPAFPAQAAFLETEAEVEVDAEADLDLEAEAETETETETETEAEADADAETEVDSDSVTADIMNLATSALAEEVTTQKHMAESIQYSAPKPSGIMTEHQDVLSQIAEALNEQY